MSIFGATDTPVSAFWWRLLWVSKPEWAALFELCRGVHDIRSLRFTSGVTPLPVYMASTAAGPFPYMRVEYYYFYFQNDEKQYSAHYVDSTEFN